MPLLGVSDETVVVAVVVAEVAVHTLACFAAQAVEVPVFASRQRQMLLMICKYRFEQIVLGRPKAEINLPSESSQERFHHHLKIDRVRVDR